MGSLPVYSMQNKKVGSVDLPDELFIEGQGGSSLIHQAVVMQRASLRQGTASTRGRGEVSGSGKKPWKQKHTGRARAGSVRSPIWRHGGIVFGPKPRKYGFQMPKKMYRCAMRSVLASKLEEGNLVVLDQLNIADGKTKVLGKVLSDLGVHGKSVLTVDGAIDDFSRLGRNLKNLKVLQPKDLNVYDLLWCEKLVVTQMALTEIKELWG